MTGKSTVSFQFLDAMFERLADAKRMAAAEKAQLDKDPKNKKIPMHRTTQIMIECSIRDYLASHAPAP